jgi:hypothetical protein
VPIGGPAALAARAMFMSPEPISPRKIVVVKSRSAFVVLPASPHHESGMGVFRQVEVMPTSRSDVADLIEMRP